MKSSPQASMLLCAEAVLTQDNRRNIITDGAVLVRGGRIAGVGKRRELEAQFRQQDVPLRDFGRAVLMPGLVNAHTHLPMSLLRGLADDLPLMTWLEDHIFPLERLLTPDMIRIGTLLSCAEMMRTGSTAFCDMYMPEMVIAKAASAAGLRGLVGEGITIYPTIGCSDPAKALEVARDHAEMLKGHPLMQAAIAPHSVYTSTPELLESCAALADELNLPLHIHLAETRDETTRCLKSYGCRPVEHCRRHGMLTHHTLAAHCVDLDAAEITMLAQYGVSVAHSPKSNMKLASGVAPIPAMLKAGVNVALGTDGAASNNMQNMHSEMTVAALLHKATTLDPTVVNAQAALDMATRNGAAVFHITGLGTLTPGAPADITVLGLNEPGMNCLHSVLSHTVYAATGLETVYTMVNGKPLYDSGRYLTLDYPAVLEEARGVAAFLRKKAGLPRKNLPDGE